MLFARCVFVFAVIITFRSLYTVMVVSLGLFLKAQFLDQMIFIHCHTNQF